MERNFNIKTHSLRYANNSASVILCTDVIVAAIVDVDVVVVVACYLWRRLLLFHLDVVFLWLQLAWNAENLGKEAVATLNGGDFYCTHRHTHTDSSHSLTYIQSNHSMHNTNDLVKRFFTCIWILLCVPNKEFVAVLERTTYSIVQHTPKWYKNKRKNEKSKIENTFCGMHQEWESCGRCAGDKRSKANFHVNCNKLYKRYSPLE